MKIISKFKDYYDYYIGIFGEDPLKVLDRSEYWIEPQYSKNLDSYTPITLFFCGNWYYRGHKKDLIQHRFNPKIKFDSYKNYLNLTILYEDDNIYWSKIENYDNVKKRLFTEKTLNIISKSTKAYFILSVWNISKNSNNQSTYYPILKDIMFDKVLDAKDCYLEIEQYISKQDLNVETNPDDKNLLEAKGFDKKISFRHRK